MGERDPEVYLIVCFIKSHSTTEREAMEEPSFNSPTEIECPSTPDIVKVVLRGHEGVEADQPLSLTTTQTVSCCDAFALQAGLWIIFTLNPIVLHVHVVNFTLGPGPTSACGEFSYRVLVLHVPRVNFHVES